MTDKVATTSPSIELDNLSKLRAVFPTFIKDHKIDFDALQAFFKKEGILADEEKYGLSWSGKSNAFNAIRTPATGTLIPQKDESKNWDTTGNIFIEGDNLEVLKLLQKYYTNPGLIKMIYIDPPYNTGKDFVYKDNFHAGVSDYYEATGQTKGGIKMNANTEKNGRYHSDWLTMMYPRLFLSRNLLRDDGVIFVSIDDNEVANLRLIMDEIFGEENFVLQIAVNRTSEIASNNTVSKHEYIIVYAKTQEKLQVDGTIKTTISRGTVGNSDQTMPIITFPRGLECRGIKDGIYSETRKVGGGSENIENLDPIYVKGGKLAKDVRLKARWRSSNDMRNFFDNNCNPTKAKINGTIIKIYFENDKFNPQIEKLTFIKITSLILDNTRGSNDLANLSLSDYFEFPKSVSLIKQLMSYFKFDSDVILDFFAGSGTTAHAVMDLNAQDNGNRQWICVQLPELTVEGSEANKAGYKNIADIARDRIRKAGDKIVKGDIGFKSFKLNSSNYRRWTMLTDADDKATLLKQTKLFLDKPLVDNYKEEDLVYEILLKEGFNLHSSVTKEKKDNLNYYQILDGEKKMIISFIPHLTQKDINSLKLAPDTTFVCLDSALDDTTKVNISRSFKLKVI